MASFGVQEFIREAQKQLAFYNETVAELQKVLTKNALHTTELDGRLNDAYTQLCNETFGELSPTDYAATAQTMGFPRIANVVQDLTAQKRTIESELVSIQANEQWQKREALTHPTSGVLSAQISELEPLYTRVAAEEQRMNCHPRLAALLQRGYGTSAYPHKGFLKFLNAEYLDDWKAADEIVAQLGVKDFSDVAYAYGQARDQRISLEESLRELRSQRDGILAMDARYIALQQQHTAWDSTVRAAIGKELYAAHTVQSQNTSFAPQNIKGVENARTSIDGIQHQQRYVQELSNKVMADINTINEKATKLSAEKVRYESDMYRFRNKQFSDEQFAHKFNRSDRYSRMAERYNRTGNTIVVFNDYNRADGLRDFLWWDVITDGRLDGNFIPDVYEYRTNNPDYHYHRDTPSLDSDTTNQEWADNS